MKLGSPDVLSGMLQEIPAPRKARILTEDHPVPNPLYYRTGAPRISNEEWERRFNARFAQSMDDYYNNYDRSAYHPSSWWSDVPGASNGRTSTPKA